MNQSEDVDTDGRGDCELLWRIRLILIGMSALGTLEKTLEKRVVNRLDLWTLSHAWRRSGKGIDPPSLRNLRHSITYSPLIGIHS